ncbi:MAG: PIN domain-containing protein [Actinobacteria bacterium]|nr:PIN domain-containing protein [Actinomycetota bacterium]
MPAIDVVSDAIVVMKWFHAEGEGESMEARALVEAHRSRTAGLAILDIASYEVGNALLCGRAGASAGQVAVVLDALSELCTAVSPRAEDFRRAGELAEQQDLALYDAAYAAVAESNDAELATLDSAPLDAGLGARPAR